VYLGSIISRSQGLEVTRKNGGGVRFTSKENTDKGAFEKVIREAGRGGGERMKADFQTE